MAITLEVYDRDERFLKAFSVTGDPVPEASRLAIQFGIVDVYDSHEYVGSAVRRRDGFKGALLIALEGPYMDAGEGTRLQARAARRVAADFAYRYIRQGRPWDVNCIAGSLPAGWVFPAALDREAFFPLNPTHLAAAIREHAERAPETVRYVNRSQR